MVKKLESKNGCSCRFMHNNETKCALKWISIAWKHFFPIRHVYGESKSICKTCWNTNKTPKTEQSSRDVTVVNLQSRSVYPIPHYSPVPRSQEFPKVCGSPSMAVSCVTIVLRRQLLDCVQARLAFPAFSTARPPLCWRPSTCWCHLEARGSPEPPVPNPQLCDRAGRSLSCSLHTWDILYPQHTLPYNASDFFKKEVVEKTTVHMGLYWENNWWIHLIFLCIQKGI